MTDSCGNELKIDDYVICDWSFETYPLQITGLDEKYNLVNVRYGAIHRLNVRLATYDEIICYKLES